MEAGREPLPTHVQDTPALPAAYDGRARTRPRDLGLELDALGARRHRRPRPAAPGLDARHQPDGHPRAGRGRDGHVVDSLTAVAVAARPRAPTDPRPGLGRRVPGHPDRGGAAGRDVALVEPIGKKARFLRTVVEATGLAGRVAVVSARAEALAADPNQRGRGRP